MDARRAILQRGSKKVLIALLVTKRRRGGDSEEAIEQLVDDVHPEKKRQVVERVLEIVRFRG